MRFVLCLWCLSLFMLGCPGKGSQTQSTSEPTAVNHKKILTQAILFKVAAHIQQKYVEKYKNPFQDDQRSHFLIFLNETVLSKKNIQITNQKALSSSTNDSSVYTECADRIIHSDKSYWTIKKILGDYHIPDSLEREGDVLFNPYIFLPGKLEMDMKTLNREVDMRTLWDWFYTAILLDEQEMVKKTYPLLIERVSKEFPGDQAVFKNIYGLYNGEFSQPYEAAPLSYYYLITGNLDQKLLLSDADNKKLKDVIEYYDRHFYQTSYIAVSPFTLKNKLFMWLAARQQEQAGHMNKAYVYIKTTFDNSVLRNIKQFHPINQVYLYTTIRIALQIHSPQIYRYVYGALDPLTKFEHKGPKELLKMQLLQLID